MDTAPNKFDIPVKFGILTGIVSVVIQQISYGLVLPKNFIGFIVGMFALLVVIVVMLIITAIQQRKAFGGYISFKNAFQAVFISILVSSIIATLWAIIYTKFINPDLADTFKSSVIGFMEHMNAPQEKIDEAASKMKVGDFRDISIGARVLNLATIVITKSVVGLLAAAIARREPKAQMQ